jgi:hypothetical protein
MAEEARDSGICVDNDIDSLSTSSSLHDFNQLSTVQKLRKRFECLAKEQELEFHPECNWWLEEEGDCETSDCEGNCRSSEEERVHDVRNKVLQRNVSAESEKQTYSKQSSIKSQVSRESITRVTITPSTPVKEFSSVTFTDYQENNETNDSDSFDSESDDDESKNQKIVNDEVEEEEDLPPEYIRNSRHSLKLMRPISITSQTSK